MVTDNIPNWRRAISLANYDLKEDDEKGLVAPIMMVKGVQRGYT